MAGAGAVIKIMQGIKLNAPRGPVEMDEMRNRSRTSTSRRSRRRRCRLREGRALEHVIKTFQGQSVLDLRKEKFLAQPVYDRDFPPCKFCDKQHDRRSRWAPAVPSIRGLRVSSSSQTSGGQGSGEVPVLELRQLCKSFGGLQATREVTLRIMPGDRQAIIGQTAPARPRCSI